MSVGSAFIVDCKPLGQKWAAYRGGSKPDHMHWTSMKLSFVFMYLKCYSIMHSQKA